MTTTTKKTTGTVKVTQMALYLAFVAVVAFLSCMTVRASGTDPDVVQEDPQEIESWMLTFCEDYLAEESEETILLEAWMINEESFSVVIEEETDEDLRFEAWMFNFELLDGPVYYAELADEDLYIEDWMLSICCWDISDFMADR